MRKPALGKLSAAIGHVFAAEDSEPQHFARRELRGETGIEVPADWLGEEIDVAALHLVVDHDAAVHAGCRSTQ